jgi:hypothetical protein
MQQPSLRNLRYLQKGNGERGKRGKEGKEGKGDKGKGKAKNVFALLVCPINSERFVVSDLSLAFRAEALTTSHQN